MERVFEHKNVAELCCEGYTIFKQVFALQFIQLAFGRLMFAIAMLCNELYLMTVAQAALLARPDQTCCLPSTDTPRSRLNPLLGCSKFHFSKSISDLEPTKLK